MAVFDNVGTLRHHSLLALVWACFGAAFLVVSLRTVVRLKIVGQRPTSDDCWIYLALTTLLTLCILETVQLPSLYYMTAAVAGAIPVSTDLITNTEEYLRFEFPIIILFWSVLWCVKGSFLALYYKLFRELRLYRRVWYGLSAFTFLAFVGCVTSLSLSCRPTSNFFKFAQCGKSSDIWASNFSVYYSTVIDVFTDVCIMAMPLRLIYNVQVSLKQKAGLVCVFGLGFATIAFAIIRAKQVLVEQYFVNLTLLMIWSTLAASISVIVGSLPAFKVLVTNHVSNRSRYGSSNGRKQTSKNASLRSKSVKLSSLSSDKKSDHGRLEAGDSQEDILKSDGSQFVLVRHDVNVSYSEMDRPQPIYPHRQPVSPYGRAM